MFLLVSYSLTVIHCSSGDRTRFCSINMKFNKSEHRMFRAPSTKCGLRLTILTSIIVALFVKSNGEVDILKFCEMGDLGLMAGKCPYIHLYI